MGKKVELSVFRGEEGDGEMVDYDVEVDEGMVVLDVVHELQYTQEADLACRWNCKAGKCGSCSAEVNGESKLMCMTRLDDVLEDMEPGQRLELRPMQTFPHMKDLVTDVSWNYEVNRRIPNVQGPESPDWEFHQFDAERVQEFRECIECFLCQNTCHVLREHQMFEEFAGPRFFVRMANLEMHPMDTADRIPEIKDEFNIGYCNITRCCTEVCPAGIHITDNAIIPLKERVVDRYYSLGAVARRMLGRGAKGVSDPTPLPSAEAARGGVYEATGGTVAHPIDVTGEVAKTA